MAHTGFQPHQVCVMATVAPQRTVARALEEAPVLAQQDLELVRLLVLVEQVPGEVCHWEGS